MQPADLQPSTFGAYPPLGRACAQDNLALLRQLPLPLLPILLREVSTLDWKFPRERQDIQAQLEWLGHMSATSLGATVRPFQLLQLPDALSGVDWVNDAPGYMEQLTATLWATHQMPAFRDAAKGYAEELAVFQRSSITLQGLAAAQEGMAPQAAAAQVGASQGLANRGATNQAAGAQVGTAQVGASQGSANRGATSQAATAQVRASQGSANRGATSQAAAAQVGASQGSANRGETSQAAAAQVGASQGSANRGATSQAAAAQVGASQGSANRGATSQAATGKAATGEAVTAKAASGHVAAGRIPIGQAGAGQTVADRGVAGQAAITQGRPSPPVGGSVGDQPQGKQVKAAPPLPRLVMVVLAASLGQPASGSVPYRSLRREGVLLDHLDPADGFATLRAHFYQRAQQAPLAYAHWHIDGAAPAAIVPGFGGSAVPPEHVAGVPETDLVHIGYDTLAPTRERLLARAGRVMNAGTSGPEELRTLMAHLTPDAVGLPATRDRVLAHFELSLLTEGSGTQIFSTTFVQWASRECLRRAQPVTLLARYTPRQREQGMNDLLSGAPSAGPDAAGSRVDAEQAAWYTWLNLQRLPDAAQSRFLVWQEGTSTAVVIGPGLPRGTTSTSPMTIPQVLRLLA